MGEIVRGYVHVMMLCVPKLTYVSTYNQEYKSINNKRNDLFKGHVTNLTLTHLMNHFIDYNPYQHLSLVLLMTGNKKQT